MSDQPKINKDFEKYKIFQSVKDMIASGLSKEEVLKEIREGKESLFTTIPDEVLCFLVARHLNVVTPKPNIKSKFIPNSPSIQISDIKDLQVGTYITIKGKIITIFDDENKVTLNITDRKNTIRCDLFFNSMIKFRTKKFQVGDFIKLKSLKIKEYKGRREVIGNEYTSVFKVKE